ncbi:MAG: RecX family transcriptional regulator [Candidatus Saccharibacteria bacterium]|nr:RecX family transcriptional regulator [Candidatus Saccharibacteria bacterium]
MLETHTIFEQEADGNKKPSAYHVTDIKEAVRDKNRVNIYINDKFFCSLDISQVIDLHIKIGRELEKDELDQLKRASDFGKFYARALEYSLTRPHSSKEIRDYLKRKTLDRKIRVKDRKTGKYKTKEKKGYDASLIELVFNRLEERGYINDYRFAELWVENRNVSKGTSMKKIRIELQQKGISSAVIDDVLGNSERDDIDELRKVIVHKAKKYPDEQKLIQYLLRQGFNYSDISEELSSIESSSV